MSDIVPAATPVQGGHGVAVSDRRRRIAILRRRVRVDGPPALSSPARNASDSAPVAMTPTSIMRPALLAWSDDLEGRRSDGSFCIHRMLAPASTTQPSNATSTRRGGTRQPSPSAISGHPTRVESSRTSVRLTALIGTSTPRRTDAD